MSQLQNVPSPKTSQPQNIPTSVHPNSKMSQDSKHHRPQNVPGPKTSQLIGELGRFETCDILVGRFWGLGLFEARMFWGWDVLGLGRFRVGTFWGLGRFEVGTFWGLGHFGVGAFCIGLFCSGMFCLGTFCRSTTLTVKKTPRQLKCYHSFRKEL
jgi:hypothetical protein